MNLKLLFRVLTALVSLGNLGGLASADAPPQRWGPGTVLAIAQETLTIEDWRGTFDVLTDPETVFRVRGAEDPSIEDIHVGDRVTARIAKQDDSTFLAKAIIVLPAPLHRPRALGRVTAVEGHSLSVENREGTFEILADADTIFRVEGVEDPSIEDIQVGDVVAGRVIKQDGALLAKAIVVPPPPRLRGLGKVTTIEGRTLTVETRRGTFDVLTDDETLFRVKGVEDPSIEDVQVGDLVAGRVAKQRDGTLLARAIAVVPSPTE